LSASLQDYLSQIGQLEFEANPDILIPGHWLTDPKKAMIFLPIKIPKAMPLDEIKFLTDGRSLLMNVVARPSEAPEDASTKKYREILEAFKFETKGDLKALDAKLKQWGADEDDPKVQALIHSALAADGAVVPGTPRSITIPLSDISLVDVRAQIGALHANKKAALQQSNSVKVSNPHGGAVSIRLRSTYLQRASRTTDAKSPDGSQFDSGNDPNLITIPLNAQFIQALVKAGDYVVPLKDKAAFAPSGDQKTDQSYIKDSLSVQLPYPCEATTLFAVEQSQGKVVVIMPYTKATMARSDQAFARVPVYDMQGHMLVRSSAATTELSPVSHSQTKLGKSGKDVNLVKSLPTKISQSKPAAATPDKKLISLGDAA